MKNATNDPKQLDIQKLNQILLKSIYRDSNYIMILVDKDRKVKSVNNAAIKFAGSSEDEMIGLKGGAALRCLNHLSDPKGCGYGPECKDCKVKNTVVETFEQNKDFQNIEGKLPFLIDGEEKELTILVSTSLLTGVNGDLVLVKIEDITERKLAEKSLKDAQKLAKFGNWELDLVSNTLTWSDEVYRIFDLEPDEFGATYEAFLDNIHPDDREMVNQAYNESLKNKAQYDIVHRLLLKDGTLKYVHEYCKTFYNEEGKAVRSIGTVQDITERKLVEEKLKESEELNKTLLDTSPDVIYIYDFVEKKNIYSNEGVQKILGYSVDEIKKMGENLISDLMHPDDFKVYLENVIPSYLSAKDEEIIEHQYRMKHKKGHWLWLASKELIFLRNDDGSAKQIFGIIRDITKQKIAQEEKAKSETRFKALYSNSPAAVYEADADGKCKIVNAKWCEYAGITEEEAKGDGWIKAIHKDDREYIFDLWNKHYRGDIPWDHEYRFCTPQNKITWVHGTTTALKNEKGETTGYIGVNIDITEKKEAEEKIKASEIKYRMMFENMQGGVAYHKIITDKKGKAIDYTFIDINEGFEKLTGLERKKIIGKNVRDVLPGIENDPADWIGRYGDVALNNKPIQFENYSQILDKWYNVSAYCPQKGYFTTVFIDITERKRSEIELAKTKELLHETERSGKIGGWEFDVETLNQTWTEETFKILEIESVKGEAPKVPEGLGFIDPEFRPMAEEALQKAMQNGEPYNQEWIITTAKGNKRWVNAICRAFKKNGKVVRLAGSFQDITERKIAEEKLREKNEEYEALNEELKTANQELKSSKEEIEESEERYQYLSEAAFEAIFISEKGICIEQNTTAEKMFGYSFDEAVGNPGTDWIIPEDREKVMANMLSGYEHPYEVTALRKDGTTFPCEIQARMMKYKGRDVRVTALHDISERKKAEEKLKESEEKYRKLVELSPDAVLIHSDGIIQFVNSAAVYLFEAKSKDNLIGKNITDFVHPDFVKVVKQRINNIVENDVKAPLIEEKLITLKGNQFFAEVTALPISLGGKAGVQVVARDITERKIADDKLRASKQRFKDVVEMLPEAVFETDIDLNITYVNKRGLELSGYTEQDIKKGINGLSLLSEESQIRSKEYFQKRLAGENPGTIEYIGVKKDGTQYPILFHANSIIEDGKLKGLRGLIVDITERKEAELLIKKEKDRAQKYLDIAGAMLIVLDENGNISLINNKGCEILGYKYDEIINKNWFELCIHKDIRKEILGVFNNLIEGKIELVERYENTVITKNGELRDIAFHNTVIRNENSEITGIMFSGEDITEQKKAESSLIEIEEQFSLFMKYTPVYTFIKEVSPKESRVLQASDNYIDMIGIHGMDMIGKTMHELFPAELATKMTKDDWTLYNKGEVFQVEEELNNKIYTTIKFPLTKAEKKLLAGFTIDITERKQAEEKILEQKYYLEKAQDIGKIGSWSIDLKNNIIQWTEENYKIFGVPVGTEMNYDLFLECIHPEDREYVNTEWTKALETKSYDIVHRLLVDNKVKWVREKADIEYDNKGNAISAIGITHDITEQKLAEQQLEIALKKAQEADMIKSAFLATMSHELRTPLNAIIGFSDILKEECKDEEICRLSKIINSSGNHLLSIVEDLFDVTLIEAGEVKIVKKEFNLSETLNEVQTIIKTFQKKTKKEKILLNLKNPPDNKFIINSDSSRLKQILINLLKNALKFTHTGQINYGYSIIEEKGKTMLKFYVEDNGIGIPKDKQDSIFEIFNKVDDSDTNTYGGTGIGLSISKKLCQMLGGEIWVESEEGKGSTFYFTIEIDIIKAPQMSESKQTYNPSNFSGKTILVVEDDENSYKFIEIVLARNKIKSVRAKNGEEAINYCKNNMDIDIVLMDINMPGLNGYEATKEIKKTRPELPVIAQTAYAISGDREKAIKAGCNDYISKPISMNNLISKISSNLKS